MSKCVSLFIPCLVDQVLPEIGMAMRLLLEHLGYEVHYDSRQTCCGQPAFNAGHREEALEVACHCLEVFADCETIVSPSGSCTSMMRHYYGELFAGHERAAEAQAHGQRVFEFSDFLHREDRVGELKGRWSGRVGVHNSCHSCRELGLKTEAFSLLSQIEGAELVAPPGDPVCCGFGGLFYVKYEPVAQSMGRSRLLAFQELGAELLVVNDPGCIMHLRQAAERHGIELQILHPAQFLEQALLGRQGEAAS